MQVIMSFTKSWSSFPLFFLLKAAAFVFHGQQKKSMFTVKRYV